MLIYDNEATNEYQNPSFKQNIKQNSTMATIQWALEENQELNQMLLEEKEKKEGAFRKSKSSFLEMNLDDIKSLQSLNLDDVKEKSDQKSLFFDSETKNSTSQSESNHQTEENSAKPKRKKVRKNSYQGCKCKNSNCLRLHCSCFKELGYCGEGCRCTNCLNTKDNFEARNFVIQKTKKIYKKAFETKDIMIKGVKINKYGCNCSKGCEDNYCGCKKINGRCSPICRCISCTNNKISLTKQEIQSFYKPCSRKKDKIVICYNQEKEQIFGPNKQKIEKIVYKTYKKRKVLT